MSCWRKRSGLRCTRSTSWSLENALSLRRQPFRRDGRADSAAQYLGCSGRIPGAHCLRVLESEPSQPTNLDRNRHPTGYGFRRVLRIVLRRIRDVEAGPVLNRRPRGRGRLHRRGSRSHPAVDRRTDSSLESRARTNHPYPAGYLRPRFRLLRNSRHALGPEHLHVRPEHRCVRARELSGRISGRARCPALLEFPRDHRLAGRNLILVKACSHD